MALAPLFHFPFLSHVDPRTSYPLVPSTQSSLSPTDAILLSKEQRGRDPGL